jgi:protein-S-isoprenylcysteine O-methyltransferase Ste14
VTGYLGALAVVVLLGLVLSRVFLLKRRGITAIKFGAIDKTDFLIPPVMLFYFYLVFAHAFGWRSVATRQLLHSAATGWAGVLACAAGLLLLLWSLISFKQSFRIGIDTDRPDALITSGIFSFSRNPIYVAFAFVLIGEFLIFPKLDLARLCRRFCPDRSPPSAARGGLSDGALWPGVSGLLRPRAQVCLRTSEAQGALR